MEERFKEIAQAQREAHMKSSSRRAKANQRQGSSFENTIRNAFRLAGFPCEKVDESDGFNRGWDLCLKEFPQLVIQIKATQSKASLMVGLNEAREHNPRALLFVCIHSFRQKHKRPVIRVAYSSRRSGPASITDVACFMEILRRAGAAGEYLQG